MKKILLIEDDPTIRQATQDILILSGYNVFIAENGREGINKAKEEYPDLIVCDIEMPELDGYGVQKIINNCSEFINTPFIFLSGRNELRDIRKGMDSGADDYLTKPFSKSDLISAIESRLKKIEKYKSVQDFKENILTNKYSSPIKIKSLFDLKENEPITTFEKKEYLYQVGQEPTYLYYLISGRIKVIKSNDDGKDFYTYILSEGSFLGHQAILNDEKIIENAECMEDSKVICIPKQKVLDFLAIDRQISFEFIKFLNKQLIESEQKLINMAYDSVRKRTADALIELHQKFKNHPKQDRVEINISRDELAAIVGTATETVIRVIRDFKRDNIIEIHGRAIFITELDKLRNQSF